MVPEMKKDFEFINIVKYLFIPIITITIRYETNSTYLFTLKQRSNCSAVFGIKTS